MADAKGESKMVPLQNITVGQLLRQTTARYGEQPAVQYRNATWTYRQMQVEVDECAAAFVAWGVQKGDHVALWAETEPEVLFAFYALQKIGAVAVMLNTSLRQQEVTEQLLLADVRYLCVGKNYKEPGNMLQRCPALRSMMGENRVLTVGRSSASGVPSLGELRKGAEAVWWRDAQTMEAQVTPQDTAVILFTSGSTSRPKAVLSSHYARVNNGIQQAADMHCTCEDRFCVAIPMFHCFCISINLVACLACGGCLCIPRDRHTASILETIESCRCTMLSAVPAMYYALLSKDTFRKERVASLRAGVIGGAHYPPERFVQIERELGFTLLSSLGQTESTAGLTVCQMEDPLELRSRTVGRFMSHVEGRIVDLKTGRPLPPGQPGEICVRGYLTMQGYYKQPELTRQVLQEDGWLHTGDMGVMDEAGYVTLTGRVKELIIRGGENISPAEIETILLGVPQVRDCKVVGVPDRHYGEEICACICVQPGAGLTEHRVRQYLSERLAHYKVPRYVLFWPELPRTSTGKISGGECTRRAAEELG